MQQSASKNRTMTSLEWALLLALATVWGGSFFFNEIAVRELPVFTVVVSRVALAAIILLMIMRLRGERLPHDRRVWAAFFGMGILNNAVPFSLIVWGQQHIASGVASILNASTPLFTVMLAHLLTSDERMTVGKFVGVLIGFTGVAVMIGQDAMRDLGTGVIAQFLCLAGAVSYAFAGIYGRRFRAMGISPMGTATGQVIASSLIMLPLVMVLDRPWTLPPPSLTAIGALVGRGRDFNRFGLCTLLPHSRHGRGHQPPAGDISNSGQRDPAWNTLPRRNPASAPFFGDGADRCRSGGNRRAAIAGHNQHTKGAIE